MELLEAHINLMRSVAPGSCDVEDEAEVAAARTALALAAK